MQDIPLKLIIKLMYLYGWYPPKIIKYNGNIILHFYKAVQLFHSFSDLLTVHMWWSVKKEPMLGEAARDTVLSWIIIPPSIGILCIHIDLCEKLKIFVFQIFNFTFVKEGHQILALTVVTTQGEKARGFLSHNTAWVGRGGATAKTGCKITSGLHWTLFLTSLGQFAQHFFYGQNLTKNFPVKFWANTYSCMMILGILFTLGSFLYYDVLCLQ